MNGEHGLSAVGGVREARSLSGLGAVRAWATATPDRAALGRVLACLVLSRLALFVVAATAIRLIPVGVQPPVEAHLGKHLSLAAWVRWDAWWYLNVAERGYWFDPAGQSNVAFFPLFPLTIRLVASLVGNAVVAGLLVANLATVAAVVAFWLWVREEAGRAAAERAVLWLLVFPFSLFLHTVYAESLFILLVALTFLAARRDRWGWAGLAGGLAAATRPMGVLLFPALAWALREAGRAGRPVRRRDLLALGLVPAGLGAYAVYLWVAFGHPLAFWEAHAAGWGVRADWTLAGYWRETVWLLTRPRLQSYTQLLDALRVILPLCFVVLTVAVFRRLGGPAGLFTAATVAVGIVFAPESVGREFLAAVPAFAVAGVLDRGGSLAEGCRLLSFGALVVLAVAFVTAHFVG